MEKIVETTWNELWPIVNILNEICHGINIGDLEYAIGFKYETIFALLRKIANYEETEDNSEIKKTLELNNSEIEIIRNCFKEVDKEIEDWEFKIRIGITKPETKAIIEKLTM